MAGALCPCPTKYKYALHLQRQEIYSGTDRSSATVLASLQTDSLSNWGTMDDNTHGANLNADCPVADLPPAPAPPAAPALPTGPLPNLSPGAASLQPDQEEFEHADGDGESDRDSAYGESFQPGDTVSITSAITKYRYENGRRYHAYRDGAYWAPNDEIHNDQQDMAHHLWLLTLDNKLFLAPILNPQVSSIHPCRPRSNTIAYERANRRFSTLELELVYGRCKSFNHPQW